ncbi:uncharacterized protein LOC128227796 isoform X2 [Mya arenaria]|uniref:uncharacterized protein LOC128227796 isoform X2 n=1 Tax=Mya arenaria TaxID=6604 RepID=UPI0022E91F72|nr:uncharacterized protein LOC128227796 isoform X2 [Mya arenaria]
MSDRVLLLAIVTDIVDPVIAYPSCQNCYTKLLIDPLNNRFHCVRCCSSLEEGYVHWRFRLVLQISDGSSAGSVVLFGQILEKFFGKSATDFKRSVDDLEKSGYPSSAMLIEALASTFVGKYFYFGFKHNAECPTSSPTLGDIITARKLGCSSTFSQIERSQEHFDNSHTLATQMIAGNEGVYATVTDYMRLMVKQLRNGYKSTPVSEHRQPCYSSECQKSLQQGSYCYTPLIESRQESVQLSFENSDLVGSNSSNIQPLMMSERKYPVKQLHAFQNSSKSSTDDCLCAVTFEESEADTVVVDETDRAISSNKESTKTLSQTTVTQKLNFSTDSECDLSSTCKTIDKELKRRAHRNALRIMSQDKSQNVFMKDFISIKVTSINSTYCKTRRNDTENKSGNMLPSQLHACDIGSIHLLPLSPRGTCKTDGYNDKERCPASCIITTDFESQCNGIDFSNDDFDSESGHDNPMSDAEEKDTEDFEFEKNMPECNNDIPTGVSCKGFGGNFAQMPESEKLDDFLDSFEGLSLHDSDLNLKMNSGSFLNDINRGEHSLEFAETERSVTIRTRVQKSYEADHTSSSVNKHSEPNTQDLESFFNNITDEEIQNDRLAALHESNKLHIDFDTFNIKINSNVNVEVEQSNEDEKQSQRKSRYGSDSMFDSFSLCSIEEGKHSEKRVHQGHDENLSKVLHGNSKCPSEPDVHAVQSEQQEVSFNDSSFYCDYFLCYRPKDPKIDHENDKLVGEYVLNDDLKGLDENNRTEVSDLLKTQKLSNVTVKNVSSHFFKLSVKTGKSDKIHENMFDDGAADLTNGSVDLFDDSSDALPTKKQSGICTVFNTPDVSQNQSKKRSIFDMLFTPDTKEESENCARKLSLDYSFPCLSTPLTSDECVEHAPITPGLDKCIIMDIEDVSPSEKNYVIGLSQSYTIEKNDVHVPGVSSTVRLKSPRKVKFDQRLRRVSSCHLMDIRMKMNSSPLKNPKSARKSCLKLNIESTGNSNDDAEAHNKHCNPLNTRLSEHSEVTRDKPDNQMIEFLKQTQTIRVENEMNKHKHFESTEEIFDQSGDMFASFSEIQTTLNHETNEKDCAMNDKNSFKNNVNLVIDNDLRRPSVSYNCVDVLSKYTNYTTCGVKSDGGRVMTDGNQTGDSSCDLFDSFVEDKENRNPYKCEEVSLRENIDVVNSHVIYSSSCDTSGENCDTSPSIICDSPDLFRKQHVCDMFSKHAPKKNNIIVGKKLFF